MHNDELWWWWWYFLILQGTGIIINLNNNNNIKVYQCTGKLKKIITHRPFSPVIKVVKNIFYIVENVPPGVYVPGIVPIINK